MFNKWTQLIQIVNRWLSEDELFSLRLKCATDVEPPELALHELVSFQEECRHAEAQHTICSWLLARCQLGNLPAPHSAAALPFSHWTLAVCSYGPMLCVACIICGFGLPMLYNPFRVWEHIIKSWLLPAVLSLHFLCTNLLGNYIKSRNKIKNANFKVITYMWLQN